MSVISKLTYFTSTHAVNYPKENPENQDDTPSAGVVRIDRALRGLSGLLGEL